MEFKDISYIIAVVDNNNISQAARALFITQPALSQQIHKIEKRLGKQLFIRSGHTMTPTPACRIIAEQGRKMLAERDMMMYAVQNLQDSAEGKLAFGMSNFYSRCLLPGILNYFRVNYPQYVLQFRDRGSSVMLEKDVIEGTLDCCLLPTLPANPELEYVPIGVENICLAVPRDHPINQLAEPDGYIDINLTRNEPYIFHRESDKIALLQESLFANIGFTPPTSYTATGWDTIISFVTSGIGLSLMTEMIAGDYRPEALPNFYRIKNMDMSRQFALAYRRGRPVTPIIEKLIECASNEFARQKARVKLK